MMQVNSCWPTARDQFLDLTVRFGGEREWKPRMKARRVDTGFECRGGKQGQKTERFEG